MRNARVFAFAAAAALYATTSLAADLGPPPYVPPPSCIPHGAVPPGITPYLAYCEEEFGGWYLRGDIGMTNQQIGSLFNVLDSTATSVTTVQKGFDSSMLFGLGLGYQWNNWLRTDLTGEYRSKANFHGLQIVESGGTFTDEYRASKSEWLFLANAYVDLGTWWRVTPFVGVGLGTSYNTISDFLDVNTPNLGVAYGADASKWNFAWALHAGFAYKVTKNLTIEFAYRYLNLGSAMSGDLVTYLGGNTVNNPEEFRNITSNDFKLGVRWAFEPEFSLPRPAFSHSEPVYMRPQPSYEQPPSIYAPPAPAYQPPAYPPAYPQPMYQQPVRSRG